MFVRRIRWWLPLGAALAVGAAAFGVAGPVPAPAGHHWRHHGHHRLSHVFLIIIENHASAGQGVGLLEDEANMPFLNHLADTYGRAPNFFGVTHPSEPNYMAATSGSTWWTNDDDGWNSGNHRPNPAIAGNHYPHKNIVDQLEARHVRWAAYMDAMPTAGYLPDNWPKAASGLDALYESKHNPFILYNNIRTDPARRAHIKPYDQLAADLSSGHAPRYVWISPNLCNDLHGGVFTAIPGHPETPCPFGDANDPAGDPNEAALRQKGDAFIKDAVHTITHSRAWRGNSAIFIFGDEGDFTGNEQNGGWEDPSGCCDSPFLPAGDPRISPDWPGGRYGGGRTPMVVVTQHGPRGVVDQTEYNTYSLLRTIEEGFGLDYLGYAGDTEQVSSMWPLLTRHRGWPGHGG